MNKKLYLKDIATIHSGYSFRTRVQNDPEGNTYVIQMRDVSDDRTKIVGMPHKVGEERISNKHHLNYGDILFMGKGANNFAVCYAEKYEPAVAASAFFIIKPDQKVINPKYLCWYLNGTRAQAFIESKRAGSYIPNVNKSDLRELEVIVPPIEQQIIIAKLSILTIKERNLRDLIKDKRTYLMNSILTDLILNTNGKEKH